MCVSFYYQTPKYILSRILYMRYITVVKAIEKKHICPFCHEKPEHMLDIGKYFYVIPARAPYVKHHLLIIPKRHVNTLMTLSPAELKEMNALVDKRAKKLLKKYKDVNLLLRDGLVKDKIINKSINHLHFHILPNVGIHIETRQSADNREWMDDALYTKTAKAYKKTFLS